MLQRAELRIAVHLIWECKPSLVHHAAQPVPPSASAYHWRESLQLLQELNQKVCKEVSHGPCHWPTSGCISSTSQRGKVNTLPSQPCPDLAPSIYRLVPPTCECHVDNPDLLRAAPLGTCRGRQVRRWWHQEDSLPGWDLAEVTPDTAARWEGTREGAAGPAHS